jgi:hypothetical protein
MFINALLVTVLATTAIATALGRRWTGRVDATRLCGL